MAESSVLAKFEEYLVEVRLAPATIVNYLADVRDFVGWLDDSQVNSFPVGVRSDHIRRYCQALRLQGRCASTVNRRLQALRKFYDFATQQGISLQNPARDVERLDEQSGVPSHILTADEVRKLLRAVGSGQDSVMRRDRAILLLLLKTGLKVSELVDLRIDDVELDVGNGYVFVGRDLGSGGRCLAIDADVCAALRSLMRVRVSKEEVEHLFVNRQGRPLSIRSVQRLVSTYAEAAGLEGVSAHTLRYTFAHDALEEIQDPTQVAQMLGLRDVSGIQRYSG